MIIIKNKQIFFLVFTLFLFSTSICLAQNNSISGTITDSQTGEYIIGAGVYDTLSGRGNIANDYGFYSLLVGKGKVALRFSAPGYTPFYVSVNTTKDTTLNISLHSVVLKEVVITANEADLWQRKTQMSVIDIPIKQLERVPTIGGESDIIKVLATTPGVSVGNEGSTALLVRGGSADQNLILLDDAIVYNVSHLYGFLSVFNTDAINHVELLKGGFPSRYGGRLSSVLDVTMKEGNNQKITGKVGLGLTSAHALIEGPLYKDKLSFIASARASYIGLVLLTQKRLFEQGKRELYNNYQFYDVNAKINYKFDEKNRLFVSFYNGHDNQLNKMGWSDTKGDKFTLDWGNTTLTMRYNRIINPKLFMKTIGTYTKYAYNFTSTNFFNSDSLQQTQLQLKQSSIEDQMLRWSVDYLPSNNHYIRAGVEATHHKYVPSRLYSEFTSSDTLLTEPNYSQERQSTAQANEIATFIEDDWTIHPNLSLNAGLRYVAFFTEGKSFAAPEPRASLRWTIAKDYTLKASYSYMQQYIHLLTSSGLGYNNDIWVPATTKIPPEKATQWALGLGKSFTKLGIDVSIEAYYKTMHNLVNYRQGANVLFNYDTDWQDLILSNGDGKAYGMEWFVQRKNGKLNGWLSYTLSWNNRQFDEINLGKVFPFKYDRRHNINVVLNYEFSPRFNLSLNWVYMTGGAYTLPIAFDSENFIYGDINSQRLPAYHRADVGANINFKHKKHPNRKSSLNLSLYNAYNRFNPVAVFFSPGSSRLTAYGLFPIMPGAAYSISF
jgi:outer membrane receptor for ferrienterochelin and colicin